MSYTSITFICFLLVTGIAYFLVPRRVQWGVLLAASLGFYVLSCGARTLLLVAACGILSGWFSAVCSRYSKMFFMGDLLYVIPLL